MFYGCRGALRAVGLAVEGAGEVALGQVMKGWTHLAKSVYLTLQGMELLKYFN